MCHPDTLPPCTPQGSPETISLSFTALGMSQWDRLLCFCCSDRLLWLTCTVPFHVLFLRFIHFNLKGGFTERKKRDRKSLHPLVHSPHWLLWLELGSQAVLFKAGRYRAPRCVLGKVVCAVLVLFLPWLPHARRLQKTHAKMNFKGYIYFDCKGFWNPHIVVFFFL